MISEEQLSPLIPSLIGLFVTMIPIFVKHKLNKIDKIKSEYSHVKELYSDYFSRNRKPLVRYGVERFLKIYLTDEELSHIFLSNYFAEYFSLLKRGKSKLKL